MSPPLRSARRLITRPLIRAVGFGVAVIVAALSGPASAISGGAEAPDLHQTIYLQFVFSTGETTRCSGTLIDDRVVLTAAHCTTAHGPLYSVTASASQHARVGSTGVDSPSEAIDWVTHPDYNDSTNVADLSLIFLGSRVSDAGAEVSPAPILSSGLSNGDAGRSLLFAGYGVTATGAGDAGNRLSTTLPLAAVEAGFVVTQPSGDAAPCSGDSGGSVYVSIDGERALAAVISAAVVQGECGQTSDAAILVAPHLDWISEHSAWSPIEETDGDTGSGLAPRNDLGLGECASVSAPARLWPLGLALFALAAGRRRP